MTKTATRPALTQKLLDSIKPGEVQLDHRDGYVRGLALRVSPGGTRTWVLVKRIPGKGVTRIRLGHYAGAAAGDNTAEDAASFPEGYRPLTLKQAREAATRTLGLIARGRDPREERQATKVQAAADATHGTLRDLLQDYTASRAIGTDRRAAAGERQRAEFVRILDRLSRGEGKTILAMKARDVEPAHVVALLRPIFHHGTARKSTNAAGNRRGAAGRAGTAGAPGSAAKAQAFLRAAFAWGISSEHSVARQTARGYGLVHNPVASIPRESNSTPGTRALSASELRQFWNTFELARNVGPVVAALLKFAIATAGQRVLQISREPWESFDAEARVMQLTDSKGKGGMPRLHLVPLTDRATKLLEGVRRLSGDSPWPWSTTGRAPIDIATPASAVRSWLISEHAVIDGVRVPPFTPRDLRRTCTQIMQTAGIAPELADRLQSHGVGGVTSTHYRNNPELYLPEKFKAMAAFDAALRKILAT